MKKSYFYVIILRRLTIFQHNNGQQWRTTAGERTKDQAENG